MICPPGKNGDGGVCDCTKAIAANEGKWGEPYCTNNGKCVMRKPHEQCKENLLEIEQGVTNKWLKFDDGTYCYKEWIYTNCPMTNTNGIMLYSIVILPWIILWFNIDSMFI